MHVSLNPYVCGSYISFGYQWVYICFYFCFFGGWGEMKFRLVSDKINVIVFLRMDCSFHKMDDFFINRNGEKTPFCGIRTKNIIKDMLY